jgi:hypothetical protein
VSTESRKRALFLVLLSLALTGLIAAGLSQVTFAPGLPLPSFEDGQVVLPRQGQPPLGMGIRPFAAVLVLIVLGASFLAILIRAARGIPWKRLLGGAWSLFWKMAMAAGLVLLVASLLPHSQSAAAGEPLPPPRPLATAPLGPVPPGLVWATAIALGTVLVLLVLRVLLARGRAASGPWVQEVLRARSDLVNGGDVREVIIRCYSRMAGALQEERGIEREVSMTAGEFEALLAARGLPRDPVRQLTRLFEAARYSRRAPAPGEERTAISCLDAILEHCRQAAAAGLQ